MDEQAADTAARQAVRIHEEIIKMNTARKSGVGTEFFVPLANNG